MLEVRHKFWVVANAIYQLPQRCPFAKRKHPVPLILLFERTLAFV